MRPLHRILIGVLLLSAVAAPRAWAAGPRERYAEAVELVKRHQPEQAFMLLRALIAQQPDHPVAQQARFMLGEYYADTRNRSDALRTLGAYLERPTDSWWEVIATTLVIKLTPRQPGETGPLPQETALKEHLASTQFFLGFRDARTRTIRTPMGHLYLFREFVDHLELERDGMAWYTISLQ